MSAATMHADMNMTLLLRVELGFTYIDTGERERERAKGVGGFGVSNIGL
jgi:hypothetical protein